MAVSVNIEKKMSGMVMKLSFESLSRTLGILGTAESGKSLLFRCIAGLETPSKGRIQINGKIIYDSGRKINLKAKDRKIGYLFSDYALFPNLTVEQNIACGYSGKHASKESTIEEYIHKYELETVVDTRPADLTEDQKLRTALARIMIGEPELLLIDEPFREQHGVWKDSLYLTLRKYLTDWNGDYILASQNPEEIFQLCERIVVPGEGVSGSTERIFRQPETLGTAYLTGVQNFSRIEYLDEYHVRAVDWGIALRTQEEVQVGITHVGIRCEDLQIAEGPGQNCMEIQLRGKHRGMYFTEYEACGRNEEQPLLLVRTDKELEESGYLFFPPEKLMVLK